MPNVLPRSLCGWPRSSLHLLRLEEGHKYPIVHFAYLCHMIGEELVFCFFLYIELFEIVVEVTFSNRSAVTHHKVNLLNFRLRRSSCERTDDAFLLLICFCIRFILHTFDEYFKHHVPNMHVSMSVCLLVKYICICTQSNSWLHF